MKLCSKTKYPPLGMHGPEYVATTWAIANMNMIIHDMEGTIEIGDTFKHPKFRAGNRLQTFDRVVSKPTQRLSRPRKPYAGEAGFGQKKRRRSSMRDIPRGGPVDSSIQRWSNQSLRSAPLRGHDRLPGSDA
jgi:type I restriction enzyme M protein